MILKCEGVQKGSFVYYDIDKFATHVMRDITQSQINDLECNRVIRGDSSAKNYATLFMFDHRGREYSVLSFERAYLMNETGKTVEVF